MKQKLRRIIFKYINLLSGKPATFMKRFCYFIYASEFLKKCKVPNFLFNRNEFYSYLISENKLNSDAIDYLEFGVSKGESFKFWIERCKNPQSRFFGFDTFMGIPDDWGSVKKGAYTANGSLPTINDNRGQFIVGLFNKTLIPFLKNTQLNNKKVIHLDADLYSSTLYVLVHLNDILSKDDIIIFDEFFSVTKSDHEFRAFIDFLSISEIKYVPIARGDNQLAIMIV